jgi:NADH:ubiquinone oxidoreductase subunit 2 (subunit N)
LGDASSGLIYAGVFCSSSGRDFKAALVPFHMWTPAVYGRFRHAVLPSCQLPQAAAFIVLIRLLALS